MFLVSLVACSAATDDDDDPTPEPVPFDLLGSWDYTGGFAGLTNALDVTGAELQDTGDFQGTEWWIQYDLLSWDNDADRMRLEVAQTDGFTHVEVGDEVFMSWRLEAEALSLYSAHPNNDLPEDDYADPSGGDEGVEYFTYSRRTGGD